MSLLIRFVEPGDVAEIAAIYGEAVRSGVASYELEPPGLDEMRERFMTGIAQGFPWFACVVDGVLAGYAYASYFRTRPAYRWLVEDSIYLAASMRGRGLGFLLLDRLLAECEQLGYRQMIAVIGGANPASIAVHRKAGFVDAGCIRASGYKFGQWLDTTLMQRPLGDGAETPPGEIRPFLATTP